MIRLRTIRPPTPVWKRGIWRARSSTAAAPISPKIAPEAPTVRTWGETRRAPKEPRSSETRIHQRVAQPPEGGLEHHPEVVQDPHVEGDVDDVLVQEAGGDDPPPFPVGDTFSEEASDQGAFEVDAAGGAPRDRQGVAALGQEHDHVDRDQGIGDERATGGLAQAHHFGALGGALRTAHPDRGAGHAVGADRAPAVRAGDARLA